MSINDREIGANKAVDQYAGVANPTPASIFNDPKAQNFVTDPTTEVTGAGAGPDFDGPRQAQRAFAETAGVVEGRPGVLESANIDPLNENSNKDDGWANATRTPGESTGASGASGFTGVAGEYAESAKGVAANAADFVYGAATGQHDVLGSASERLGGFTKSSSDE